METTWRYYDYDYDNNTIIMSDATDGNTGWIMSDEEKLKSRFGNVKYPINIQHDRSSIVRGTLSTESSSSNQSRDDKIICHSPPRHQHKTSNADTTFVDNANINPRTINPDVLSLSGRRQYLYNYHYHYFQGLLQFQRITSSNDF